MGFYCPHYVICIGEWSSLELLTSCRGYGMSDSFLPFLLNIVMEALTRMILKVVEEEPYTWV